MQDALSPLQGTISDADLHRLTRAIAATVGIDALVWMVDVAGLTREEAVELMRWSAQTLLRSALEERDGSSSGR